jgi:RimJ/RimL family protein N-acetyltransferase
MLRSGRSPLQAAAMDAATRTPPFPIRRLVGADAGAYRDVRLEALRTNPEAFGSSLEEEAHRPTDWFRERVERNPVFGAGFPGGPLAGMVGLQVPEAARLRHKAILWGMFVPPGHQGCGLGWALVACALDHAATIVEEVRLSVVAANSAAIRLYTRAGFERYGLERRALKSGARYDDEVLMAVSVARRAKTAAGPPR